MKGTIQGGSHFASYPIADIQRSKFHRPSGLKTTFDAGKIIPIFLEDVLPGDTKELQSTIFVRLATPLRPIMDNIYVDVHYFFVPNRLVHDNWYKLNGAQDNPGDSTDYTVPQMTSVAANYGEQSVYDYFGLPTKKDGIIHASTPLRAHNLIYNTCYRDQNLQNSLTVKKDDTADAVTLYGIYDRGKRHDYFTSALPFAQKGAPVSLPLGTSAPVVPDGALAVQYAGSGGSGGNPVQYSNTIGLVSTATASPNLTAVTYASGLKVDLTTATAATIDQINMAYKIQALFQKDARGGTRYIEILKSHFGVSSPDARLQRPEYLGGFTTMVSVNPIAQTSAAASQPTPQGNLAAMGTASDKGGFTHSFVEHGWIIGYISARADLTYQQGLDRMWSRKTRFDHYWPAFAHLGEQAILNKEIYAQGTAADNNVFGYQERWAEYRYKPSKITGKFRSNTAQPLDSWHLAQNFSTLPVLNSSFIIEQPPIDRISAVPSEPDFLLDCYHDLYDTRPLPVYSVPGLADRF